MNLLDHLLTQINATEVNTVSTIFKLILSLLLGSCVGLERKRKGQIAGLRTFALISMGATLAMILSIYVPQEYLGLKNGDPGRIAAQVVTGIGFLGAGAIIQMKGSVRGLTTAAGIWIVATIGMTIGVGMYLISLVATGLIIVVLVLLETVEHRIHLGQESRIISINVCEIVTDIGAYRNILQQHDVHVSDVFADYDFEQKITKLNFVVLMKQNSDLVALFSALKNVGCTKSISLANQVTI